MDGLKRALKHSLQWRLFWGLSICLISTAIVAGLVSFFFAFWEAGETQDDQLRQVGMLIKRYGLSTDMYAPQSLEEALAEKEALISVQVLGRAVKHSDRADREEDKNYPLLPEKLPAGFQTVVLERRWRVFALPLKNGENVAIAQRLSYRDEMVFEKTMRTVVPLLLLVPVLSIILFVLLRKMLRPVVVMAEEVDKKTEYDLSPLNMDETPVEIQAFVSSINRLLARVTDALEMQRRFIADAAHELRSPLTALSLQIQSLDAYNLPEEAKERVANMHLGMDRAIVLLGQLLSLARSQSKIAREVKSFLPRKVIYELLEEFFTLAYSKNIDMGLVGEDNPLIKGVESDFYIVARNLIDNAIKHTPYGGSVDIELCLRPKVLSLIVSDTGEGIPAEERANVFEPFYRVGNYKTVGAGLGLSIVKAILERTGGSISLENKVEGLLREGLGKNMGEAPEEGAKKDPEEGQEKALGLKVTVNFAI